MGVGVLDVALFILALGSTHNMDGSGSRVDSEAWCCGVGNYRYQGCSGNGVLTGWLRRDDEMGARCCLRIAVSIICSITRSAEAIDLGLDKLDVGVLVSLVWTSRCSLFPLGMLRLVGFVILGEQISDDSSPK